MPEIKFAKQPREWKRSPFSILERNLDPGFEQREAKLERHCPNIVLFYLFWKRLGVDGLKQELKD